MFRHIVIGYDGTEHSRDAEALAVALARFTGARLSFVNAFYDVPAVLPADNEFRKQLRADAQRALAHVAHAISSDIAVDRKLVTGRSPARSLYEFAEGAEADLVVLGSSDDAPEGTVRAGRVASQVLDAAPCAVAIAPAGLRDREEISLRTLGVGFDGRPESEGAMSAAASLADACGAALHVIVVVERTELSIGGRMMDEAGHAIHEALKQEARRALDRAGAWAPAGIELTRSMLEGPAAEALVAEATGRDLDVLVVGSRGFGPIRRVLLGSVSVRLMATAPCPLVVVPRGAPHFDPPPAAATPATATTANGRDG